MVSLSNIADGVSIFTAIILAVWFIISRRQLLSQNYYAELKSQYAAFLKTTNRPPLETIYSGMILSILDVDNNGYFRGTLDFAETAHTFFQGNIFSDRTKIGGEFEFLGLLEFRAAPDEVISPRRINPIIKSDNRTYTGKLYVVKTLETPSENYETNIIAEYDITHYRELGVIEFENRILKDGQEIYTELLPEKCSLNKKFESSFSVFNRVKKWSFKR